MSARAADGGGGRVLVTGARGYLGSVLVPMLLDQGYRVVALDRPPRAGRAPDASGHPRLTVRVGDIAHPDRDRLAGLLADVDTVVHLAATANAPDSPDADDADDAGTVRAVNSDSVVHLAGLARASGVSRFLFASSCSVYGVTGSVADELSPLAPLTRYARAKAEAEQRLSALAAREFQVVSLRLATLFGASPRFRTDLIVHTMVASALRHGYVEIPAVASRRPLLHVRDAAEAWLRCFGLPGAGQGTALVLNVVGQNVTTTTLARLVAERLSARTRTVEAGWDHRSYWASNRRFEELTGKSTWHSVGEGVDEVRDLLTGAVSPRGPDRTAEPSPRGPDRTPEPSRTAHHRPWNRNMEATP